MGKFEALAHREKVKQVMLGLGLRGRPELMRRMWYFELGFIVARNGPVGWVDAHGRLYVPCAVGRNVPAPLSRARMKEVEKEMAADWLALALKVAKTYERDGNELVWGERPTFHAAPGSAARKHGVVRFEITSRFSVGILRGRASRVAEPSHFRKYDGIEVPWGRVDADGRPIWTSPYPDQPLLRRRRVAAEPIAEEECDLDQEG